MSLLDVGLFVGVGGALLKCLPIFYIVFQTSRLKIERILLSWSLNYRVFMKQFQAFTITLHLSFLSSLSLSLSLRIVLVSQQDFDEQKSNNKIFPPLKYLICSIFQSEDSFIPMLRIDPFACYEWNVKTNIILLIFSQPIKLGCSFLFNLIEIIANKILPVYRAKPISAQDYIS